tara:strand:+ start:202 stop:357 length:156 start_codon:yes stop_codon:yes gene_type:complete
VYKYQEIINIFKNIKNYERQGEVGNISNNNIHSFIHYASPGSMFNAAPIEY